MSQLWSSISAPAALGSLADDCQRCLQAGHSRLSCPQDAGHRNPRSPAPCPHPRGLAGGSVHPGQSASNIGSPTTFGQNPFASLLQGTPQHVSTPYQQALAAAREFAPTLSDDQQKAIAESLVEQNRREEATRAADALRSRGLTVPQSILALANPVQQQTSTPGNIGAPVTDWIPVSNLVMHNTTITNRNTSGVVPTLDGCTQISPSVLLAHARRNVPGATQVRLRSIICRFNTSAAITANLTIAVGLFDSNPSAFTNRSNFTTGAMDSASFTRTDTTDKTIRPFAPIELISGMNAWVGVHVLLSQGVNTGETPIGSIDFIVGYDFK